MQSSERDVLEWSVNDVASWIETTTRFGQYKSDFVSHHIDGAALVKLTSADLREIGVVSIGHRKYLQDYIRELSGDAAHLTSRDSAPPLLQLGMSEQSEGRVKQLREYVDRRLDEVEQKVENLIKLQEMSLIQAAATNLSIRVVVEEARKPKLSSPQQVARYAPVPTQYVEHFNSDAFCLCADIMHRLRFDVSKDPSTDWQPLSVERCESASITYLDTSRKTGKYVLGDGPIHLSVGTSTRTPNEITFISPFDPRNIPVDQRAVRESDGLLLLANLQLKMKVEHVSTPALFQKEIIMFLYKSA